MYYRKIIVPVDGSENSNLALRHAISLAQIAKLDMVLLNCYPELPAAIGGEARDATIVASEKEARSILDPCEQMCEEAGIRYKALIRCGGPGRTIVLVAQSEGCDLIVMGSRGLSDFSGMVLGSVSHRVLRHATMPVLIVR